MALIRRNCFRPPAPDIDKEIDAVAAFSIEKRLPALNHCRNNPCYIVWKDGRKHDPEVFPPPRRLVSEREMLIFPDNVTWSRYAGLFHVEPRITYKRHIKRSGHTSWLLYVYYPRSSWASEDAFVEVSFPGYFKKYKVSMEKEVYIELDLDHAGLLYNGAFSTVCIRSSAPVVAWLTSSEERSWFYVLMEKWPQLLEWEKNRKGWKSLVRRALALYKLDKPVPGKKKLRENFNQKVVKYKQDRYLDLFTDPFPEIPLYRFRLLKRSRRGPKIIRPEDTLFGPYEHLVPGFYKVVFVLDSAGDAGSLRFRITANQGMIEQEKRDVPLARGPMNIEIPFHVTAGKPGWHTEFVVTNAGGKDVEVKEVRIENDPEAQLAWWMKELKDVLLHALPVRGTNKAD